MSAARRKNSGTSSSPDRVPRPGGEVEWRVADLAARIDGALKAGLPARVRVTGEISGFSPRTHWYFSLKDADASIGCVMFASSARRSPYEPADGAQVVASGRIDFYAPSGRVSLICDSLSPVGVGERELAFRQLIEDLRADGLLDPERKRPLPSVPRRLAVITSAAGAAKHDVIDTCRRRWPAAELLIIDAAVQGERAVASVSAALDAVSSTASVQAIDAAILTRGGGSPEDLWAFNERPVAEAVARCSVPVVAAIGHESDTTIAELVADERAATPTQAAVRLTPDRVELDRQTDAATRGLVSAVARALGSRRETLRLLARSPTIRDPGRGLAIVRDQFVRASESLEQSVGSRLRDAREDVARLAMRLEHHTPAGMVLGVRRRIDHAEASLARLAARSNREARTLAGTLTGRLERATEAMLTAEAERLDAAEGLLDALDPARVLGRGYSLTTDASGSLVTRASQVSHGDRVTTRVAKGSFDSVVGGADPSPLPGAERAPKPKRRRKRRVDDQGPGLFGGPDTG